MKLTPFLYSNPRSCDSKLGEKDRHLRHESRRAANETQRRGIVDERLELGAADSPTLAAPDVANGARNGLSQFDPPVARERAQFVFVRKLVRRTRTVQEADLVMRDRQRVVKHGAQRRNAGPARDEDELALGGRRWKRERSQRTIDIENAAALERKVRPRRAVGIDADEELQVPLAPRLFG